MTILVEIDRLQHRQALVQRSFGKSSIKRDKWSGGAQCGVEGAAVRVAETGSRAKCCQIQGFIRNSLGDLDPQGLKVGQHLLRPSGSRSADQNLGEVEGMHEEALTRMSLENGFGFSVV